MAGPAPQHAASPVRRDSLSDRLYDAGFFLVEAFAALEVTAVIAVDEVSRFRGPLAPPVDREARQARCACGLLPDGGG